MKEPDAFPRSIGQLARPVGFAQHAPRGFAAGMPQGGYGQLIQREGFAQYFADNPAQAAAEDTPKRESLPRAKRYDASKQRPETYPWPDMIVSNLINKSEAGSEWRTFDKILEVRARSIGRTVGLKNFQCVIIPMRELHDAMDERHVSAVRDPNPKRRRRIAQETLGNINGIIEDLANEEQHQSWVSASDEPTFLWMPGYVRVGRQEGCGPNGIGVTLEEEDIFEQRKNRLVSRVCRELGFNPVHFTSLEQPVVGMVDTSPLPVDRLHFSLPPMPIDMPFRAVRAYGPDHQAAKCL